MAPVLLLLSLLALAHAQNVTDCDRNHGGTCLNSHYNACLKGYFYSMSGCDFQEMCCIPPTRMPQEPPLAPGQCGVTFPDPTPSSQKIVGGTVAARGEFPWQVSLRSYTAYKDHMCGGILISDRWILTAAHCFQDNKNPFAWNAILGEYDRAYVEGQEKMAKVDTLVVHSGFNSQFGNDIAMLKIATPLSVYSRYIRPVCLPDKDASFQSLACTVTGWGAMQSGGLGTRRLFKVSVPLLSNEVCSYLMDRTIPDNEICAGRKHGGQDACQGDSGGPMVCQRGGVWQVAGIVSWGFGCAEAYTPGIYSNVAHYRDWIDQVMRVYTNARKRGVEMSGFHYV